MFVIIDEYLKNCPIFIYKYIGEVESPNWIKTVDKKHAKRFETEQEAKIFMEKNKIKGELELL